MATPIRRRLPEEAGVPARGLQARLCRAEPRRPARAQARPRPGVRRSPRLHAGRRLPAHRLEGLQAAGPAAAAAVRRRTGPADLPLHRCEPVDARSRPSSIRRAASPPRSATSASRISIASRSCRSTTTVGRREVQPGRGKGRIFRVFEMLEAMETARRHRPARVVHAVRVAHPAAGPRRRHLRLSRSGRLRDRA